MPLINKFINLKYILIFIVILNALTWSSSLTPEFTGYDDIKLIVRNDRIHKGFLYTLQFYGSIVSDSHNIAWTNYPTVIYRPLEWVGSAIGYALWKDNGLLFHFFFNFSLQIVNSILIFFILYKLLQTHRLNEKIEDKHNLLLAGLVTALWSVHPLHNEAVNMLTSGVGFLFSSFFLLLGILINLYIKEITNTYSMLLIFITSAFFLISYMGSEMAITIVMLLVCFFTGQLLHLHLSDNASSKTKKQSKSAKSQKLEESICYIFKISCALISIIAYSTHRSHIVTEHQALLPSNSNELIERVFVVAPEIFFHYIKLFFFPKTLTIDQHHEVILANPFTPYHLLCLSFAVFYAFIIIRSIYKTHFHIAISLLFSLGSIAIALNIIPLYCLARERYSYWFAIGLTYAVVIFCYEQFYSVRPLINPSLKISKHKNKFFMSMFILAVTALSIRSFVRNLDWRDGEKMWTSTINTLKDVGAQQVWRYRLLQYYEDPGTKTFKPNLAIKEKAQKEFDEFISKNSLSQKDTLQKILTADANDPLKDKYAYSGRKTIASGLFFNAQEEITKKNYKRSIEILALAHEYYKEHFQTNAQLLLQLGVDLKMFSYFMGLMEPEAERNSFLAKGLMDTLFVMNVPNLLEYAEKYNKIYPNTQLFNIYLYNAAFLAKKYDRAYEMCKIIVKKYHEDDTFKNFIERYEYAKRTNTPLEF